MGQILKLGLPTGLQYLFEVGAFAGAALMMGSISVVSGAAHQIALSLAAITYMISTGISAAGSILTGHALGRRSASDIFLAGKSALYIILSFMVFTALVFIIFRNALPLLFTDDLIVVHLSASLLLVAAFFQLSDGAQCVGLGILRGIGDTQIPTFITLMAYWVLGLPLAWYLGFRTSLGPIGIWIGLSAGLTFSAVALNTRFFYLQQKLWHRFEIEKKEN
jgi:MATE family multidrug resistance protein